MECSQHPADVVLCQDDECGLHGDNLVTNPMVSGWLVKVFNEMQPAKFGLEVARCI